MSRFSDTSVNDYPELNKCPDCETYFASDTCPLCGKLCPEEMRAGNRKLNKKPLRDPYRKSSGRVRFVPWYYSTAFILVMLVFMPPVGLFLAWSGGWKKVWKVIVTVVIVGYLAFSYFVSPLIYAWISGTSDEEETEPAASAVTEAAVRPEERLSAGEDVFRCEEGGFDFLWKEEL